VVDDDVVIDLNRAAAAHLTATGAALADRVADATVPADVLEFLQLGPAAVDAARRAVDHVASLSPDEASQQLLVQPYESLDLLAPVPNPGKIICVARNYAEHAREAGLAISEIPILFLRVASTLVPQGGAVVRPTVSEELDWEGELAVVIGTATHGQVALADAYDHVAGYSIFNDVTVRDFQFRVAQYTAGKNFRSSGPFGPELVLTDDVPDPGVLDIVTEVNGVVMQHANTADMIFDVPTIINHVTEFIDLEPGDVIAMGTPSGVGFKRQPPIYLRPGDTVTVAVEGLGRLTNPVVAEEDLS
jgi:2-keto-4-pentenoate hydratase/2-oxohepta-3-ene-1,7-dioic acid hydratase in catechol pathway